MGAFLPRYSVTYTLLIFSKHGTILEHYEQNDICFCQIIKIFFEKVKKKMQNAI